MLAELATISGITDWRLVDTDSPSSPVMSTTLAPPLMVSTMKMGTVPISHPPTIPVSWVGRTARTPTWAAAMQNGQAELETRAEAWELEMTDVAGAEVDGEPMFEHKVEDNIWRPIDLTPRDWTVGWKCTRPGYRYRTIRT